jgi:uncharacterized protein YbaP (TraB family)
MSFTLTTKRLSGIEIDMLRKILAQHHKNNETIPFMADMRLHIIDDRCLSYFYTTHFECNKPYLYKATNDTETFYLFGTIHVMPLMCLPPVLRKFLTSFDLLMPECGGNADDPDDFDSLMKYLHHAPFVDFYEDTSWFYEDLDPAVCYALYSKLSRIISLDEFHRIVMLGPEVMEVITRHYIGHAPGMDMNLIDRYTQQKKLIVDLESEQDREDAQKLDHNEETICDLICQIHTIICQIHTMVGPYALTYHMMNREIFDQYMNHTIPVNEIEEKEISYRNDVWLKSMTRCAQQYPDKTKLVICGAAHLFGPHNILDLLASDGYEVNLIGITELPDLIDTNTDLHLAQEL